MLSMLFVYDRPVHENSLIHRYELLSLGRDQVCIVCDIDDRKNRPQNLFKYRSTVTRAWSVNYRVLFNDLHSVLDNPPPAEYH